MTTVTWIAPVVENYPKLALLEELGRIGKIANVVIRTTTGVVLLDDVAAALNSPADVMVWSGHGEPDGLLLTDGRKVKSKWLATQVARGCKPSVAILAACGSQQRDAGLNSFAAALSREGVNIVGFPAEASDVAAGTFIVEYIRSLAVDASVMTGFDVALESIENEETAHGVFLTPGIRNYPVNLEDDIGQLKVIMERIERRLISRSSVASDMSVLPEVETASKLIPEQPTIRPLSRGRADHIRGLTKQ